MSEQQWQLALAAIVGFFTILGVLHQITKGRKAAGDRVKAALTLKRLERRESLLIAARSGVITSLQFLEEEHDWTVNVLVNKEASRLEKAVPMLDALFDLASAEDRQALTEAIGRPTIPEEIEWLRSQQLPEDRVVHERLSALRSRLRRVLDVIEHMEQAPT